MADYLTIEDAVLGHPLKTLGKRHRGMTGTQPGSGARSGGVERMLGSGSARRNRAFAGNARRLPQAMVKRVAAGGCRGAAELKRQLAYVTREDAAVATWTNFAGADRRLFGNTIENTVESWPASWRGSPKRGHTDHIILSFPHGTDAARAEAIAREWGAAVFASGDFGDQWRYVAALHHDRDGSAQVDHIHAHFVVDKVGVDQGRFLSISYKSELNYDVMREMQAEIAMKHGVEMVASSRLSRGIVENAPREVDSRAASAAFKTAVREGRAVDKDDYRPRGRPVGPVELMKREALVAGFARQYAELGKMASVIGDSFMEKVADLFFKSSEILYDGGTLMSGSPTSTQTKPPASIFDEAVDRLNAATERVLDKARETWAEIQSMEPSAERAQFERQFAQIADRMTGVPLADPYFVDHQASAGADIDPFRNEVTGSMSRVRAGLADTHPLAVEIDATMETLREGLGNALAGEDASLRGFGSSADEVVERFLQGTQTVAQVGALEERLAMAEDPDAARAALERIQGQASSIIGSYVVSRDLQEVLARDQIMQVNQYHKLADVPAIEAIVEDMKDALSPGHMRDVLNGDTTVLQEHIKDPILRSAVAAELKNEADIGADPSVPQQTVAQVRAQMERQAELERARERSAISEADLEEHGL